MSSSPRAVPLEVGVHYSVPRRRAGWELAEGVMPQSAPHNAAVKLLEAILEQWARRAPSPIAVFRDLAIRWDEEHPAVGVDPDVCIVSPPPPDAETLRSVRTWVDGHSPPRLAIEVVSETNPRKDYESGPDKYAASGTGELWVFDPWLAGPPGRGGPYLLQVWQRQTDGDFTRIYTGDGPLRSPTLGAYLRVTDGGTKLRIADDEAGLRLWLTAEETERAAKEAALDAKEAALDATDAERVAKEAALDATDAERVAKEAALARVAALEAELATRSRQG